MPQYGVGGKYDGDWGLDPDQDNFSPLPINPATLNGRYVQSKSQLSPEAQYKYTVLC